MVEWEICINAAFVAGGAAPTEAEAVRECLHYTQQYIQDPWDKFELIIKKENSHG